MKRIYIYTVLIVGLFACSEDSDSPFAENSSGAMDGQGGSLATFALKGDYLYVVDETFLNVFSLIDEKKPVSVNKVPVGFQIETLFGYEENLYIGSRNGMFIYSLENPELPTELSSVSHFTACDPVVANDSIAFVTLHSNRTCGNDINVLETYDISNLTQPILLNSRNLFNPKGLGLYGDFLLVCDDDIKIFDIKDPKNSKLVGAIERYAFDVIIRNNHLIAVGEQGIYQYDLSVIDNKVKFTSLSEIKF